MPLEDTQYWSMTHNRDANAIELNWKSTTSSMTGDDFKAALERLATHIREQAATGTLIDLRTFGFTSTPELDQWRREQIIPAYNAAGLKRFAYLLPPGADYRPGGSGDTDAFSTDYFDDSEQARAWLKDA
jgi:hypothetical protein